MLPPFSPFCLIESVRHLVVITLFFIDRVIDLLIIQCILSRRYSRGKPVFRNLLSLFHCRTMRKCPHLDLHHVSLPRLQYIRLRILMITEIKEFSLRHRSVYCPYNAHEQRRIHRSRLNRSRLYRPHIGTADPVIEILYICPEKRTLPGLQDIIRALEIKYIFIDPFSVVPAAVIFIVLRFGIPV